MTDLYASKSGLTDYLRARYPKADISVTNAMCTDHVEVTIDEDDTIRILKISKYDLMTKTPEEIFK